MATYTISFLCFGCLIFLGGIGLGVYAFVARNKQKQEQSSYSTCDGSVVQLVERITTSGRASALYPVVEFQTNGQTYRFESEFGSRPAPNKVGDTVKVKYDPSNPQKAEVDSALSNNMGFAVFIFMAIIAMCLGGGFLAFSLLMFMIGSPSQ